MPSYQIIGLNIAINKIDKSRLFTKANGDMMLDCSLFVNEEPDKYGQCGMIVQNVSQDERKNGVKGNILGNGKIRFGPGTPRKAESGEAQSIAQVVREIVKPIEENLPF